MPNLLTPIDVIGEMIAPRFDGEDLAKYRSRVLQVAGVIVKRDLSEADELLWRQTELEGRLGEEVILENGAQDEALVERGKTSLLTWDRLGEISGPFVWPGISAAGDAPLYNKSGSGSGVATPDQLVPFYHPPTRSAYVRPGYVAVEGRVFYVMGSHPSTAHTQLPPDTTSTVVMPWQIVSDHAHRIAVVSETELDLIAVGHTHRIRLELDGTWTFMSQTGGVKHEHELRRVKPTDTAFLFTGPYDPLCGAEGVAGGTSTVHGADTNLGGLLSLEVLNLQGVEVTIGTHVNWIDPHRYWTGTFSIGSPEDGHTHEVVDWVVQAGGEDEHTHPLAAPSVPTARLLVPIPVATRDTVYETGVTSNPYVAAVSIVKGWTVVENHGFSGGLTVAFIDTSTYSRVPMFSVRDGDLLGLGPDEPATQLHLTDLHVDSSVIRAQITSEDRFTGAVAHRPIAFSILDPDGVTVLKVKTRTDSRGAARPALYPRVVDKIASVRAELLDEDGDPIYVVDAPVNGYAPAPSESGGYGTSYGSGYGAS